MENRRLIFCGDIHGNLKQLVYELKRLDIKNTNLIILGDFGAGFGGPNSVKVMYSEVVKILDANDIIIYAMRGNHDCPEFFDGLHDFERLIFIQDHKILNLSGQLIYPIGGATSVDIDFKDPRTGRSRRDDNENFKRRGSRRRCWWPNETLNPNKNLPHNINIIISHTAPLSFPPVLDIEKDYLREETRESIIKEREYLDYVLENLKPSYWFYGHYHQSYVGNIGNTLYRCLGIQELYEFYVDQEV